MTPLESALRLLLTLLLLPTLALAAPADELAGRAADVHESYCAGVASGDVQLAAAGLNQVSAVWAEVDTALKAGEPSWLLYWRGTLAQCLRQDEVAVADLEAFLAGFGEDGAFAGLSRDARRRLKRLGGKTVQAPTPPLAPAFGVGFSAAAGVAGGLAGGAWATALASGDTLEAGADDPDAEWAAGTQAAQASRALSAVAAGLGVAAVTAWVVTGVRGGSPRARTTLVVVPVPGGLAIGGRW